MPTYDYRCAKCGTTIEVWQTFSDAPLTKHEGCGGKLSKVLGAAGIVLKGSGFYKNDSGSRSVGARREKKEHADAVASSGTSESGSDSGSKTSGSESGSGSGSDSSSKSSDTGASSGASTSDSAAPGATPKPEKSKKSA